MNLKVSIDFVETEESKYRKNAALQIQQEVANVLKHAKLSEENKEAVSDTKEEKEAFKATKESSKSEKKKEASPESKNGREKIF